MNEFNVEEINLISIYTGRSRTEVMQDIETAKKYVEDNELLELSERVVGKLNEMSDEEYAGLEFVAAE